MRLIKTIIFYSLLGYSVLFCVYNFQSTSLKIPFIVELGNVPQFVVITLCILAGVVIGGLATGMRGHAKVSRTNRENRQMRKKLDVYETQNKILVTKEQDDLSL